MPKKVDQSTGEIINYREPVSVIAIPDSKSISSVKQVAGRNPTGVNLRDHPEYDGQEFICIRARIATGETGEFIIATGFVFPSTRKPTEEDAVTLITGADNVYSRIVATMEQNAFPVQGRLRKGGRAWFLD